MPSVQTSEHTISSASIHNMPAMILPPAFASPSNFVDDEYLSHGPAYTYSAAASSPTTSFELLPEANLRQVLSLLPLSERIRSAELVSKQWRNALRDQEALTVLDFSADPVWNRQVSKKLLEHLITRSTQAYQTGVQSSPTRKIILTGCRLALGNNPPMAFVETCLKQCPHLEVIEAGGFGGIGGAFHQNDLLSLLRTLNQIRPLPQLKEIWVDAWCPRLTNTWDSTAYQRAIAVDALWLTFMRMLEPSSRIKVRSITFTYNAGDQLRPSESMRTLAMRLRNLKAAVANSSHNMQVLFYVDTLTEIELVKKTMVASSDVHCKLVPYGEQPEEYPFQPQWPHANTAFRVSKKEL